MAGAAVGGALMESGLNAAQSGLDYALTGKLQKRQHDFIERMSNTQYQRTMADMLKAGLNPILAAKLGGAATPPGAGGAVSGKGTSGKGIHALSTEALLRQQKLQSEATTAKETAIAGERNSMRLVNLMSQNAVFQQAGVSEATAEQIRVQTGLMKTERPAAAYKEQFDKTKSGENLRIFRRIMEAFWGNARPSYPGIRR